MTPNSWGAWTLWDTGMNAPNLESSNRKPKEVGISAQLKRIEPKIGPSKMGMVAR